jgi:DNA polymerase III subunit delta
MCAKSSGQTASVKSGDWPALMKELESGTRAPIYLLTGEDFSRRRSEEAILDLLLPEEMRDFNFDLLDGSRLEGYHLAVLCREYPMMHDCRVVMVREAEKIKATAWEELLPYFDKPSETTVLVFSAAKLDKRRNYYKRISKIGRIAEFKAPSPEQMPGWIESWLSENGRQISWEQAQTLADQIEPSLNLVVQELEKLLTISQDNEKISDDHIEQCIGVSRDYSVFELTNAFFRRDFERTITIYHHTARTIAPQQLLSALSNSLTRLWSVSRLHARGGDYRSIATALSLNPWAVKYDLERLQSFTIPEIEQSVKWLMETDGQLKSTGVDHRTFITRFLFKVSRQRQQ